MSSRVGQHMLIRLTPTNTSASVGKSEGDLVMLNNLKMGGANTSTGLKDTYYSRDEALAVANGRPVIAGKMWAGQELVTTYYVHTPSRYWR